MGRCSVHCPDGGGGFLAVAGLAVAAMVGAWVLWQLAVVLAVAGLAFLVLAAVAAWASRLLRWRLSVVYWPSRQVTRVTATAAAALSSPPKQIGAPVPVVHVITDVKEAVR